jgi:hypothetical protein
MQTRELMADTDPVIARYVDGRATVQIGERELAVDRRDDESRTYTCPIELVAAALGS